MYEVALNSAQIAAGRFSLTCGVYMPKESVASVLDLAHAIRITNIHSPIHVGIPHAFVSHPTLLIPGSDGPA